MAAGEAREEAAMDDITVIRRIDAPAADVWSLVTDLERSVDALRGITAIERLDDGDGFGVGTRWRETRELFGREATEEMEVVDLAPGSSYTVEARSGNTHYVSTIEVRPLDATSCELLMSLAGRSSSVAGRLAAATLGRLFSPATRRAMERDLDDIAAAAGA
jgi:carbon monoxide dehydrogenase subunit G